MYSDNRHLSISGSELILNKIISNFKNWKQSNYISCFILYYDFVVM
jgi:hypothetical protein